MPKLTFSERLIDPKSADRRPRRAVYVLPTMFTAGNLLLGFLAILQAFQGAMKEATGVSGAARHFEIAALMIGVAVFLDGLDGRIARMTNTCSEFGREMDSLADCITFCLAPAVLAYAWGIQFVDTGLNSRLHDQLSRAAYFFAFLYVLCGSARLARFNIQENPTPKNPGRPGRKYFVGLPTPAAAGMVASVVYAADSIPVNWLPIAVAWIALLGLLSFLMVSTWRYRSFKDFNMLSPRSFKTIILAGILIYLIANYSQIVLFAMSVFYVGSGIVIRIGGLIRRRFKPARVQAQPETQVG